MRAIVVVFIVACTASALFVTAGRAAAAVTRPNALDRSVDAIPQAQLLREPAVALVDADRQEAAQRLMRWKAPGWLLMVLAQIAALAYFWRSGWGAALRDALRRRIRSEFWVRFCFGGSLAVIAKIAALLPTFYLYRVDRVMGISTELSRGFVYDWFVTLVVAIVASGLVAAIVLWLADRTHQWYVYSIAGVVAASVLVAYANPYVVAPLYNRFEPLRGARVQQFNTLVRAAGMNDVAVAVDDRSRRTQTARATVIGIWSSRRIVLADTLVAASAPAEIAFYEARELNGVKRDDPLWRGLFIALLAILGAALAIFVADRVGFRRDDDPVSRLALVGALLGCAFLLAVPAYCAYSRVEAARDDAYAVALTGNRAAAVRAMIRRADEHMEELCPSLLPTLFFEHSPPIAQRVAAFNGAADPCP